MLTRILGNTGFEVSLIGFGGIPIQRLDEESALELIQEASKQGINFIDTATGYGRSEELIGYSIEKTGRDKWIIATKCPARDYEGMKKAIDSSLIKLRTDVIDLYQLHNVSEDDQYLQVMGNNGALRALKEAKEAGKIKEIGITSHSLEILQKAIETNEFKTIQFPYNPVERQGEKLFERAKELNIGVIVMKPIAGGAITRPELSLRFIVENPNVSVIIPGMDKVEHIIENCKIGISPRDLSTEDREVIEKEVTELGNEFCRRCGYCAPCPEGINIPTQIVIEGYYLRYDLQEWAKERYNSLEKNAAHCVECGQCEPKCPYNLPIRKILKRVHENLG